MKCDSISPPAIETKVPKQRDEGLVSSDASLSLSSRLSRDETGWPFQCDCESECEANLSLKMTPSLLHGDQLIGEPSPYPG